MPQEWQFDLAQDLSLRVGWESGLRVDVEEKEFSGTDAERELVVADVWKVLPVD